MTKDVYYCPACGAPGTSRRGLSLHVRRSHNGPKAARNRRIFDAYMRDDEVSMREVAEQVGLSTSMVWHIVRRELSFPGSFRPFSLDFLRGEEAGSV
jgi:hypothetical protein